MRCLKEPLQNAWWLDHLRFRPGKVVAKLYDEGKFLEAIHIPSVMWPLTGPPEVFHWNNCQEISDAKVAEIVNTIPYVIGHCYTNAEKVTAALCAAGYDAKFYSGWMFISGAEPPLHHAWTVLNGTHIIDLADDVALQHHNRDAFAKANGLDEARALMVSFSKWARRFPHSERCMPFGVPSPTLLYVGCETNRRAAIFSFNCLMDQFPKHPCCKPTAESGRTITQELMAKEGVL